MRKRRESSRWAAKRAVPESPAALYELEYGNLERERTKVSRVQGHIRRLFKFSAPDDPFNQALFSLNRQNRSVLVRLWPGDPSLGIAEVIDTGTLYARRGQRDIQSARFLIGMQSNPIRMAEQNGEGFCFDEFAPVLDGEAPVIWHEDASILLEPGQTGSIYPPNVEADLEQLLAAKQSFERLKSTIEPLGSSVLARCVFTNYSA